MAELMAKLKRIDRKWWLALVALVVIIGGFSVWRSHQKYDVSKDIVVSFEGYNGHGTASYNQQIVTKNMFEYIGKKRGLSDREIDQAERTGLNNLMNIFSKASKAASLAKMVSINFIPNGNLSNGDKVKLIVRVPLKEIKVQPFEKEYTVKGLKQVKVVKAKDIMAHLKVKFVGYDGFGQAKITSKQYGNETIKIKHNGHLKNGDTVKINVYRLYDADEGTAFVGQHEVTVKVTGLTDITKISNMDDVIKLNTAFMHNENKNGEYDTYQVEKIHTYAMVNGDNTNIDMSYGSSDNERDTSLVSVNSSVPTPKITILTLYKVTDIPKLEAVEKTTQYKSYGIKDLTLEDNVLNIDSKNTDEDGVKSISTDNLPIIQKRIEKNALLIQ